MGIESWAHSRGSDGLKQRGVMANSRDTEEQGFIARWVVMRYPHWQREFEAALLNETRRSCGSTWMPQKQPCFSGRKHWWRAQMDTRSSKPSLTRSGLCGPSRGKSSAIQSGTKITARLLHTTVCKMPLLRQPRPSAERTESIFMLYSATRQGQENARLPHRGTFSP